MSELPLLTAGVALGALLLPPGSNDLDRSFAADFLRRVETLLPLRGRWLRILIRSVGVLMLFVSTVLLLTLALVLLGELTDLFNSPGF